MGKLTKYKMHSSYVFEIENMGLYVTYETSLKHYVKLCYAELC